MRLVTMRTPAGMRAGRTEDDEVVELDAPDRGELRNRCVAEREVSA